MYFSELYQLFLVVNFQSVIFLPFSAFAFISLGLFQLVLGLGWVLFGLFGFVLY